MTCCAEGAKILMIAVIFILLKQLLVNSKQNFPRHQPCKKMIAICFKLVRKLANANAAYCGAISTSQQLCQNNFSPPVKTCTVHVRENTTMPVQLN